MLIHRKLDHICRVEWMSDPRFDTCKSPVPMSIDTRVLSYQRLVALACIQFHECLFQWSRSCTEAHYLIADKFRASHTLRISPLSSQVNSHSEIHLHMLSLCVLVVCKSHPDRRNLDCIICDCCTCGQLLVQDQSYRFYCYYRNDWGIHSGNHIDYQEVVPLSSSKGQPCICSMNHCNTFPLRFSSLWRKQWGDLRNQTWSSTLVGWDIVFPTNTLLLYCCTWT